jgi:hypothetical protein
MEFNNEKHALWYYENRLLPWAQRVAKREGTKAVFIRRGWRNASTSSGRSNGLYIWLRLSKLEDTDWKKVALHEIAHNIAGVKNKHNSKFYTVAFRLYRKYNIPKEVWVDRERRYQTAAAHMAIRQGEVSFAELTEKYAGSMDVRTGKLMLQHIELEAEYHKATGVARAHLANRMRGVRSQIARILRREKLL